MKTKLVFNLAVILGSSTLAWSSLGTEFKVIANSSVNVGELSKDEVKQIMLANTVKWKDGKPIKIVVLSPDSDGADDVTKEFMGMSAIQAKKHWLTKVFGGVLTDPPPKGDTAEDVAELVSKTPGSIAIVPKGLSSKTKVINLK